MNLKVGDWVKRTAYPTRLVSDQDYRDIDPHMMFRVVALDLKEATLTVAVLKGQRYENQEFWMGDWHKVETAPILAS